MTRKEFFHLLAISSQFGWIKYTIPPCQKDCEKVRIVDNPNDITLVAREYTWFVYHLLSGEIESHGRTEPQFYNTDSVFIYSENDEKTIAFLEAIR